MSMSPPIEATLALDALAIGAQVVACRVDVDGTAAGFLFEHRKDGDGTRYWRNLTKWGDISARGIVAEYDDMVVTRLSAEQLPLEVAADAVAQFHLAEPARTELP